MSAGWSAGLESRRSGARAEAFERAAAQERQRQQAFAAGQISEVATLQILQGLLGHGYEFLADRRWPGSRSANVDLILVGAGGVFIIDTKWWKEVRIANGQLYRGQADVTDEAEALAQLVQDTQSDFAELGISPNEIHGVIALHERQGIHEAVRGVQILGQRDLLGWISSFGTRHTRAMVEQLAMQARRVFPVLDDSESAPTREKPATASGVIVAPEPVLEAPAQGALLTEEEVREALTASVIEKPIEDWMAFLHPSQAKLVNRSFNGPSRIRGAAGTGKTVVALHRAAYLARAHPGKQVLVSTFVATLPDVLASSLKRLAPDVRDRVRFRSVHKLALDVLDRREVPSKLNPTKADAQFTRAWNAIGRKGPLGRLNLPVSYWKEEIIAVIKSRGITNFDRYADLPRTGRRYGLQRNQRDDVWKLYTTYERYLREAGVWDFPDVILLATQALAHQPYGSVSGEEPLAGVIIDEVQDLSCAQLRFLSRISDSAQEAMMLVGDGQQSIYPGGYALSEVGISVAGRGIVLDVNYRNTGPILEFASALVAGEEFADIEGTIQRGDGVRKVERNGPTPTIWQGTAAAGRNALLYHVADLIKRQGVAPGDIGILTRTRAEVATLISLLTSAGHRCLDLEKYSGQVGDQIKVGTIKRAKGLEFKRVAVCAVSPVLLRHLGSMPDAAPNVDGPIAASTSPADLPTNEAARESHSLAMRELFVAMTRARDGLWVGSWGA